MRKCSVCGKEFIKIGSLIEGGDVYICSCGNEETTDHSKFTCEDIKEMQDLQREAN